MALFPGTPRVGVSGLWMNITFHLDFQSGRGLNQSCNSPRELSNTVSHSINERQEEVDSRLLIVRNSFLSRLGHGAPYAKKKKKEKKGSKLFLC